MSLTINRRRTLLIYLVPLGLGLLALVLIGSRPRALPLGVHTIRADDAMLRQVQELGAQYLIQVFAWDTIEPSPGRWDWEYTDWLLRAADYYGLRVIARLDKPPTWAVDDTTAVSSPPRNLRDYTEFVRRVAQRYKGKIPAYIVWNEPNLAIEWGNRMPNPAEYVNLLEHASAQIRSTDPNARIVAAGLAPTNENSERARDDRAFLREMYAAGAKDAFDILAAHPYAFAQSPDTPHGSNEGLNFARIKDLYDIMVENGDAQKPIWITEFGYPTEQPSGYENRVVTESLQAEYIARAYDKTRDELPFVQAFTVWNIVRNLPPSDEQSGYSLVRSDGSMKPAFDTVKNLEKQSPISNLQSRLTQVFTPAHPSSSYPILARDAVVHLGDSEYPAPFVPLYMTVNPATDWKGEFYLNDADLEGLRRVKDWTLYVELMQVNDFDTRVWVNDVPLTPAFLPVEDFTGKWVSAQFKIPAGALRVGYNAVAVRNGKLFPAFQQVGFTWDDFQMRNVRLQTP